jgi:hypothetical protein
MIDPPNTVIEISIGNIRYSMHEINANNIVITLNSPENHPYDQ